MKIYTKSGDNGTTGLQGGKRVSKSDSRIIAYGTVDELNSILGIILSQKLTLDIKTLLKKIQNDLFILGSDLSNPDLKDKKNRVQQRMINYLEKKIDRYEKILPQLSNFVLPGGHFVGALFHFARTVTRRAEITTVNLSNETKINEKCIVYLNRLSDLLFVLARLVNYRAQIPDTVWKP